MPVLAIHGTADPVNGWQVGPASPPYWTYGVEEALARWAAIHRCAATPREARLAPHVVRVAWDECEPGAAVELVRVEGGGHTWPGSAFAFPPELRLGATSREVDATALLLEFFGRVRGLDGRPRASTARTSPRAR